MNPGLPRLREDLALLPGPALPDGQPSWTLHDPARNLFFRDLYNADGTFRSDDELRAAFERAGVDLSRPIVTSCGSGVTASVLLFALQRLGIEDAALYDGSWSEWGADPDTPKAQGPEA